MFAPLILLPSQLTSTPPLTPEHRLVLAVLKDAVHVLTICRDTQGTREKRFYRETHEWFVSEESSPFSFSFTYCCEMLKFDAPWLRRQLLG